jgi:phosphoribosylanthranilate isomerase
MIPPGAVKICGNRDPALCRLAVKTGADLLGFIFVLGVKRQIDVELAAECIQEAKRSADRQLLAVGVFVDEQPATINRYGRVGQFDLVQLHGSEQPESLVEIDFPVVKVIRPKPAETKDVIESQIASYASAENAPIAYLIDGFDARQHGGAGVRADWNLAAEVAKNFPIMLAGGLTPENIGSAIETVCPIGVDVSSGVETEGVRDPEKIKRFILEAKRQYTVVSASHLESIGSVESAI